MIIDAHDIEQNSAISQISKLENKLFGKSAWSSTSVQQELNAPARTYILDVDEHNHEKINGYAGYWYDGYDAQIMTIAVDTASQQQGIATQLMQTIINKATQQGAQRILLEVRVDNTAALALYQHFGFERMGIRKRYYQPEGIDAYTMSLDIQKRIVGFSAHAA